MRFQSTRQCRICFEDISRFDFSSAVRPCKCKGTQQFVHHKCLKTWLDFSNHTQCHVCLFKFEKYKRKDGCAKIFYNMIRSNKGLFFIIQVLQCLFAKMITKVSLYNLKMGHQLKISLVPSVYMQMIDSIISFQPLYLSLTFIIKNLAALCRVAMIRFSWINSGRFKNSSFENKCKSLNFLFHHSYYSNFIYINSTISIISNSSSTQNQHELTLIEEIGRQILKLPILYLYLYSLYILPKQFQQGMKGCNQLIGEFREENWCFVEYKKTKRYQIMKLEKQLEFEQNNVDID
eukprot:403363440